MNPRVGNDPPGDGDDGWARLWSIGADQEEHAGTSVAEGTDRLAAEATDPVVAASVLTDVPAPVPDGVTAGDIETCFDGSRWFNRVRGTRMAANFRATRSEAEFKGRAMAQKREVGHLVRDVRGDEVSYTRD